MLHAKIILIFLIKGIEKNLFAPNNGLTRAEFVAVLDRLMKDIDDRFGIVGKLIKEKDNL